MKITENVHALKHSFTIPVSPEITLERFVYSFIILGKEKVFLVDSGLKNSFDKISDYLNELGKTIKSVDKLLLTHSHPDHIGSAKQIKDSSNCEVLAHINEKDWIEDLDKQFSERPVPGFKNFVTDSVEVDKFLEDGETIELETGLTIKVIHTPGHSSGSVSLLMEDEEILICGDALLLPGDLPIYENVSDAVASINKLKELKNIKHLLSSWDEPCQGNVITGKFAKSIGYFKMLHDSVNSISEANELDPMTLCKKVVEKLGMPPAAINPLVAKSFQSNLKTADIIF